MMKKFLKKKQLYIVMLVIIFIITNSYQSNVLAAKPDKTPPTAPTNLRASSVKNTSISFIWDAAFDKTGVKSYDIYKNNALIGNSTITSFTASGLTPSTTYNFYVKAKDAAGNLSSPSNTLTINTEASVVTPTPSPTLNPTPTTAPTVTPTPTTVPTVTVTPAPTAVPTQPVTPIPTVTVAPTVSPTPTMVPTLSPTPTITPTPSSIKTKVVGYYAAWAAYSGFYPDKIDASKLTHINYAFANIDSDLKITLGYPDVDLVNFSKLNELKKTNPNLKTIISVGGWSWSGKFSDAALTDASRATFADSCVNFIVKYGFDGVDLDWEYPVNGGLATNVKRPEDKHNFTLLLQKLREKLDAQGLADGKHYILTFAGSGTNSYINNTELNILKQYVDYGNIMTYDIHGTWDTYTDFNAPLYSNTDSSPQYKWSVDESVNTWIKTGYPADKIVMGVPFYGYLYSSVTNMNSGLYQSYSGSSSISYGNVEANYLNKPGFIKYFHIQSKVPWLFNGSIFISYEDEQSIGYKAQYIKSKGLGGAMIWELSQDPNRVLLNSLYNNLQ